VTKKRHSILVVDDDVDILQALLFLLEDEGYTVQISEKGEYVESLRSGDLPDLIILDVLLSGKDGRTICRKLKSQDETKHIPVLMTSAHPNAGVTTREVGADAFIAKPFSIDDILAEIADLLAPRQ
jgi:DNA-binding response OmpR family regulator